MTTALRQMPQNKEMQLMLLILLAILVFFLPGCARNEEQANPAKPVAVATAQSTTQASATRQTRASKTAATTVVVTPQAQMACTLKALEANSPPFSGSTRQRLAQARKLPVGTMINGKPLQRGETVWARCAGPAAPTALQAAQADLAKVRAEVDQLRKERDDAQAALKAANESIAKLEQSQGVPGWLVIVLALIFGFGGFLLGFASAPRPKKEKLAPVDFGGTPPEPTRATPAPAATAPPSGDAQLRPAA